MEDLTLAINVYNIILSKETNYSELYIQSCTETQNQYLEVYRT